MSFPIATHIEDREGDDIVITTGFSRAVGSDTSWLDSSSGGLTFDGTNFEVSGTPPGDNSFADTYTVSFYVTDEFGDKQNVYTRDFVLLPNE